MLIDHKKFNRKIVITPHDAWKILKKILSKKDLFDRQKEHLYCIGINNAGNIIYIDEVSVGSSTGTVCHPVQIFRHAVLKGATGIIVAHNHPSGRCVPSNADMTMTERLRSCGEILEIKLLDSIIICEKKYYSFALEHKLDKPETHPQTNSGMKKYSVHFTCSHGTVAVIVEAGSQQEAIEKAIAMKIDNTQGYFSVVAGVVVN